MTESSTIPHRFRRHFKRKLVSGILVLVPLGLTFFLLKFLFETFTGIVLPLILPFTGQLPRYAVLTLAFLSTFLVVYLCGVITAHFVGQRLLALGEAIILRLPVAKSIYSASKQIVNVFAAGNNTSFKAVVLFEFPRLGTRVLGFATGSIRDDKGMLFYNVFVPTTPNPTSGFLILVPEAEVTFTEMPIEDGIRMIVSGGVLSPGTFKAVDNKPFMQTA